MKKHNQKLLSVISAALLSAQVFTPMLGMGSSAADGIVKFGTPTLDAEKDAGYEGSYTIKLSDFARDGKLPMNAFQVSLVFEALYVDAYADDGLDLFVIHDDNGNVISREDFEDVYYEDFGEVTAEFPNAYVTWTEEGIASKYFTEATFSFMWDDNAIYTYVEVRDDEVMKYSDTTLIADRFSSGWSNNAWLIDAVEPTYRIQGIPHTDYGWSKDGEVVVNDATSTDYSDIKIYALADKSAYYADEGEHYLDTTDCSYVEHKLTGLNGFCINWWRYCGFLDDYAGAAARRAMACDGSDTIPDEKTCAEDFQRMIDTHILGPDQCAERDAGRAANLKYAASKITDEGYVLEYAIPLTEEAMSVVRANGSIDFQPLVIDSSYALIKDASFTGGNASKWYCSAPTEFITLNLEANPNPPVTETEAETEVATEPETMDPDLHPDVGDINGDGVINAKDLTRLMKKIAGENVVAYGSDVNGDGKTNAIDLTRLMKIIAGPVVTETSALETEPEVTEPETAPVTEPAVTEPETAPVTEPEVTEPETAPETEPVVTEPETAPIPVSG